MNLTRCCARRLHQAVTSAGALGGSVIQLAKSDGLRVIADGGVLVTVRAWNEPVERGIRVFPVLVMAGLTDTAKLERLRDQAEAGVLTARVARVLPASQAADAHRMLEKDGVRGRLVLDFTKL